MQDFFFCDYISIPFSEIPCVCRQGVTAEKGMVGGNFENNFPVHACSHSVIVHCPIKVSARITTALQKNYSCFSVLS